MQIEYNVFALLNDILESKKSTLTMHIKFVKNIKFIYRIKEEYTHLFRNTSK